MKTPTITSGALRVAAAVTSPTRCTNVDVFQNITTLCRSEGVDTCLVCKLWMCSAHLERGLCGVCRGGTS